MVIVLATAIAAFHLIQLHGPGGYEIDINPHEVSSIREPSGVASEGHFAKDIRCLLFMTNGKVTGVIEDCKTVKKMTEEAQ